VDNTDFVDCCIPGFPLRIIALFYSCVCFVYAYATIVYAVHRILGEYTVLFPVNVLVVNMQATYDHSNTRMQMGIMQFCDCQSELVLKP